MYRWSACVAARRPAARRSLCTFCHFKENPPCSLSGGSLLPGGEMVCVRFWRRYCSWCICTHAHWRRCLPFAPAMSAERFERNCCALQKCSMCTLCTSWKIYEQVVSHDGRRYFVQTRQQLPLPVLLRCLHNTHSAV